MYETVVPVGHAHSVAVRLLLPFLRVCGCDPRALVAAQAEGLDILQIAQGETRLSHAQAMRLLSRLVRELDDPELGLKAGAAVQHGDMEVAADLAGSQLTLRGASESIMRYFRLLRGGAEFSIEVTGPVAMWRYRLLDQLEEPAAAHDFVVSCVSSYVRLLTGRDEPKLEVHLAHRDRSYVAAHQRMFRCPIKFGMDYTGVVFPAERLSWPIAHPTVPLSDLFESRARERLRQIDSAEGVTTLVRQTLHASIESGDLSMPSLARRLGLSVPTLRRKLAAEGTSHTEILDQVRKQLALSLLERQESANKVSLYLGFADATTFHRAFRRWTGMTPTDYRKGCS